MFFLGRADCKGVHNSTISGYNCNLIVKAAVVGSNVPSIGWPLNAGGIARCQLNWLNFSPIWIMRAEDIQSIFPCLVLKHPKVVTPRREVHVFLTYLMEKWKPITIDTFSNGMRKTMAYLRRWNITNKVTHQRPDCNPYVKCTGGKDKFAICRPKSLFNFKRSFINSTTRIAGVNWEHLQQESCVRCLVNFTCKMLLLSNLHKMNREFGDHFASAITSLHWNVWIVL